jgi:hypothetical protein
MLEAFFDGSGWDGKSPAYVLAGYLAKKERWADFSNEWYRILRPPQGRQLPYLKANDVYRLKSYQSTFHGWSEQERDERLIEFVKAINRHVMHGIVSVMPVAPYVRLMKGKFNPSALDRPYFLSFFGVMTQLLLVTQRLQLDARIDFIFDIEGGDSHSLLHSEYERFISVAPEPIHQLCSASPRFERDEDFAPIQAADLLAWHARRYYFDLFSGKEPIKKPSNVFFANLFKPEHDILDLWDEARIRDCANTLLGSSRAKIPIYGQPIVTYHLRSDPTSPARWKA